MGAVVGAEVVDLFAGSGALGMEALSRGARHVTFVDSSRRALDAVRANIEVCGFSDRSTVVHSEALSFLAGAGDRPGGAGPAGRFDLALLDPPYRFVRWDEVQSVLRAEVAAMESDREIPAAPGWEVLRSRRYGSTVVTIVGRMDRDEHGRATSEERS
jgi:16S rRNA (guanine966-N2)-methyltransferase